MSTPQQALQEDVVDFAGAHLRSITEYTESDYNVIYARDDVAPQFTNERLNEMHEALILRDLGRPYFQQVFDVGTLESSTYRFEDATVFHFVYGEVVGLYVSVDPDTFEPIPAFTDHCQEYLRGAVDE